MPVRQQRADDPVLAGATMPSRHFSGLTAARFTPKYPTPDGFLRPVGRFRDPRQDLALSRSSLSVPEGFGTKEGAVPPNLKTKLRTR